MYTKLIDFCNSIARVFETVTETIDEFVPFDDTASVLSTVVSAVQMMGQVSGTCKSTVHSTLEAAESNHIHHSTGRPPKPVENWSSIWRCGFGDGIQDLFHRPSPDRSCVDCDRPSPERRISNDVGTI